MKYTYLLVDFFTIIIPLLFSFHPRLKFYKAWTALVPAIALPAAMFITWDYFFTKAGIWSFNPDYLTGIKWLGLPMEEVLFFICIPYACVFTFFCLNKLCQLEMNFRLENFITAVLVTGLFTVAIINFSKAYTFSAFLVLAILLVLAKSVFHVSWLGRFYMVYAILILPFMVVNGVLTGSWIDNPVVIYNPSENLEIRLGTIPVEDVFYGMALILFNLLVFVPLDEKRLSREMPLFFKDVQQTGI